MDKVYTRGLAVGSLFEIVVIGLGFSLGPLIVFYGFLSMFGAGTVTWNDEPVTGVGGLLLSVVMAPVMVLLFSVVIWLFLTGFTRDSAASRSTTGPKTIPNHRFA